MSKPETNGAVGSVVRRVLRPLINASGTLLATSYLGLCRTPYPVNNDVPVVDASDAPAPADVREAGAPVDP